MTSRLFTGTTTNHFTSNSMWIATATVKELRPASSANLFDPLPITKNAIVLPLPSYSLKVVEEYVGFKQTQDEYGGSWAMAQFILATETAG